MNYRILGNTVPAVEVDLTAGESVYTQSGGMAWMSEGVSMTTNTRGGVLKGLGRVFSGESMFMATYTAEKNSSICFASTVPGAVLPVNVSEHGGFIIQKGAFLCAQDSVSLETVFRKKLGAGLFGGEGFIMQKLTGSGMVWLEVDGDAVEKELAQGEVIKVDTGNVVGFDPSVGYEIEMVKGLGNILLGGEGLFLTVLTGPGKVVLQTQNFMDFAGRIASYIPQRQ